MSNDPQTGQVVYTNKAHCRDCYRCVRVCPVKAIRMENGQAYVVADRCISCGTCVRECPQGAKQFRNDIEKVIKLISSGDYVAVSIAPSFVALFNEWEQKRIPSALRKLGFSYVGETAIGAYYAAKDTTTYTQNQPNRSHICTACPAVVGYVEKYDPEKVDLLVPVVSPMIAHAKHIRETKDKEIKVVFIGPCVAKKAEADWPQNDGIVDAVLTFSELIEWFERENIDLSQLEESRFDEEPAGDSRFFPLIGGSVKTANLDTDQLAPDVICASGFDEICAAIEDAQKDDCNVLVEPLFCPQGCVNGPAIASKNNVYKRRHDVLKYANTNKGIKSADADKWPLLATKFKASPVDPENDVSEEQIQEVMGKTGKTDPANQLNCGACGYVSCRDKAIAVVRKLAEPEMCIPYMKRLAEQRTDKIIETSPNGIIILDDKLQIISMNQAFRQFFMCTEAVLGRPISYLMDPDPFEKLASGKEELVSIVAKHDRYNIVCHEILYAMREENQFVGIFVNVTNVKANKEKLDQLRLQTAKQARELLEHQIQMAQNIAKYLGESTAQGEELLDKLMVIAEDESNDNGKSGNDWLWDTINTSK